MIKTTARAHRALSQAAIREEDSWAVTAGAAAWGTPVPTSAHPLRSEDHGLSSTATSLARGPLWKRGLGSPGCAPSPGPSAAWPHRGMGTGDWLGSFPAGQTPVWTRGSSFPRPELLLGVPTTAALAEGERDPARDACRVRPRLLDTAS